MRIGVKPGQWGWAFRELEASWEAAEEAGFDLVSCFDHATAAPAGRRAWDAPSLLVAMAGRTARIRLAVHVLNVSLRNPFLLAGQLAVAQAASGGRLEVGLGAGSYHLARFDHAAAGIAFPKLHDRLRRLEACCRTFPALWRGEEVTDADLGLQGASLGHQDIDLPPITVGGRSDGALEIAARFAEAWNAGESDPDRYAALVSRLQAQCARQGRDRPIAKEAQLFVREIELHSARDRIRGLEEAGADTAIFVLDEERGPENVRRLADFIL